jgi:hypothetical protein
VSLKEHSLSRIGSQSGYLNADPEKNNHCAGHSLNEDKALQRRLQQIRNAPQRICRNLILRTLQELTVPKLFNPTYNLA